MICCFSNSTAVVPGYDVRQRLSFDIRRLRQSNGWSQEELADRLGLHRTCISDLERGVRNPTITVVDRLAVALEMLLAALLSEEGRTA